MAKRKKLSDKYYPTNLFLGTYGHDDWFKHEKESADFSFMQPIEDDKKVSLRGYKKVLCAKHVNNKRRSNRRKRIKNLNSKKILIRLPVLLTHIETGNNLYKLRNEIRQI